MADKKKIFHLKETKIFYFIIAILIFPLVISTIVIAAPPSMLPYEPYHNGATLVCSDCHTMHASQQHGYTSGSGPAWSTTPTAKLLRKASAVDLCLSCHDQISGIPDVMTTDVNGLTDRAAGFFPASPGTDTYKGHNLAGTNPGYLCTRCHFGGDFGTAKVTCVDCHNPHGNAFYRNLQWAGDPPATKPIIAFTNGTGINRYDQNNVGYSAPPSGDNTWREVTNICLDCHHVFSGEGFVGSGSPYIRHPFIESERGGYYPINKSGANTDPAHWVSGTGNGFTIPRLPFAVIGATNFTDSRVVAQNNEVFCLSCHKVHGSNNAFGLRWAYGSGPPGTSQAGCNQCHNK